MSGLLHHIARRGFEATQDNYNGWQIETVGDVQDEPDQKLQQFPAWGLAMIFVTFMSFLFIQLAVSQATAAGYPW